MIKEIKVDKLSINYDGHNALDEIWLEFEKGKLYSIIGPNGAGKSSLLKSISKWLKVPLGTIYIQGKDIQDIRIKELAKKIAQVPQETNLEFDFSGREIVMMGRNPHLKRFEREGKADMDKVEESMDKTNTLYLKDRNISRMSGGEKQRIIVARALAQEAGIMLLDEPVSQLDLHNQLEIMNIIKNLVIKEKLTALCVLHDINLAANYSDEIILLKEGKVFCKGSPEEVITDKNILDAYSLKVTIINNPVTGKPHVLHADI